MLINKDDLANFTTLGGITAFLADLEIWLTALVLVTALVFNLMRIIYYKKGQKDDK